MSTILVTGAAGLLGSNFARYLLDNTNHKLILIDDLSGGIQENADQFLVPEYRDRVVCCFGPEWDVAKLKGDFTTEKVDYIAHFAAYAAEGLSPFIRKFNYQNNLIATTNLVNLAITWGVRRFLFTSSMAVYGDARAPFNEDYFPDPIDPYGVAKYAAEMDIQIAGEQHGLDWCIIRPHNVFGVGQNLFDKYRNVLGIWMWQALNDHPITIYGDGEQTRAFSYIGDIVEPLYVALTSPKASKEIINLGGIEHCSVNQAAEVFRGVVGNVQIDYLPHRHEVKHAHSTWQKSVSLLGFAHKTSLEDGIREMWEWAKTLNMRERFEWKEYELDRGIYPFWVIK